MAIRIAVANNKGGVGKTTTVQNIADALYGYGYKVLAVDSDPQASLTFAYDEKNKDHENTIRQAMAGECKIQDAIVKKENRADILIGDIKLLQDEGIYATRASGINTLNNLLKQADDQYDFMVMDTPPNLGIYMINVLLAATGIIIPMRAEAFSLDGLNNFMPTYRDIKTNVNPDILFYGVLVTGFQQNTLLGRKIMMQMPLLMENYELSTFKHPYIRISQDVPNAQATLSSLYEYNKACNAALDYAGIAEEILKRHNMAPKNNFINQK